MHFDSRRMSLVILAITSIASAKAIFTLINDPEGPNLLVVVGLAAVNYIVASAIYRSKLTSALTVPARLAASVGFQICVSGGFYLLLR